MSVALIELVEMTATLNAVVSINSTTVMHTYWTTPLNYENTILKRILCLPVKFEIQTDFKALNSQKKLLKIK